jgi:hypothetical protein
VDPQEGQGIPVVLFRIQTVPTCVDQLLSMCK